MFDFLLLGEGMNRRLQKTSRLLVGELVVGLRFEVEDVHYYEWDISIEGHKLIEVKAERSFFLTSLPFRAVFSECRARTGTSSTKTPCGCV